ncbi:MAG: glucuronate isomerase [Burkholderiaceae bacterium]|nr:glucuronate isomerase [Burkholderiaceae bacterium]
MPPFVDRDFLLDTTLARTLYHEVAAELPIVDYHSHLQPGDIAARKRFRNVAELWLGGDHYKWRLMRACGVAEDLITGAAGDEQKFHAWCKVLPLAIGNPLHHWSHLELRRLFGIDLNINAANAGAIWEQANARLAGMDSRSLLEQARVEIVCTTDDPADDLARHAEIARSDMTTRVLPAYRPDRAMRVNQAEFPDYLDTLGRAAGQCIDSFAGLIAALDRRVTYFHERGARISDHAIDHALPAQAPDTGRLEQLFAKRIGGDILSADELGQYQFGLLAAIGKSYARHDWAMCLHIGAQRDNSRRLVNRLGTDSGGDSISDTAMSGGLAALLDALDADDSLPRTVLFCLNPAMNEVIATMTGNFQDGSVAGKIQFGPAWWFNDHKEGNLRQIAAFASHGVLGGFIGMVTDSRSFASYPRHDYFRRLLCRQLGAWVEGGEYPADRDALETIVRGVCYENAKRYFKL